MRNIRLARPLESYITVEERPRADGRRQFEAVLRYTVLHAVETRRHRWSEAAGVDAGALRERCGREVARFAGDIERWLVESRQQLVEAEGMPALAPIEDGA